MSTFRKLQAERDAVMTDAQREEYDQAYRDTGRRIDLAQMFYDARTEAGLSQTALAQLMGTSQSAIARIEAAGSSPSVEVVERLARATGKHLHMSLEAA